MSKIKIKFDPVTHVPEKPTIILANKNGEKIDQIKANNIIAKDSMTNPSEISFNVNKIENNIKNHLWDKIVNFRLAWCREWNTLFELSVDVDESNKTVKYVSGVQLGKAELSKIKLFNIEINTEKDIERDDYEITILFDENNPKGSLLHRITEKTPHYSIAHVDASIAKIQRTFSFDDVSIDEAFQEIAEEIGCIFIYDSGYDENGKIIRSVSVYDLQQNCNDCGYRGEFTEQCPKCNSHDITDGYGNDTTIFITSDEIANDLKLTTDTKSVNNCFKLEAGDDLMTATVRNCNPNGSDYIWYISDDMKELMSDELVSKLDQYDQLYSYYQKDYSVSIDNDLLNKYNEIVSKYKAYNQDLEDITIPIIGYPNLMTAYYNTIDLNVYLQSTLMPNAKLSNTTAEIQTSLLTPDNLSPVAVSSLKNITLSTANNAVLGMAKSIIDSRYQTKIDTSVFSNNVWTGNFIVTNYSDDEDTFTSPTITLTITDNYEKYVNQRIQKLLNKEANDLSISGLFKKDYDEFCIELKKYCLDSLTSFYNICQSCIDILIEQGIANNQTWADKNPNLYNELYIPYRNKLAAIQSEISVRDNELNTITGIVNDGETVSNGLQTYIIDTKNQIQDALNFEKFLGKDLWLEFCTFRREDKYSNNNYISDGLNNSDLFKRSLEFLETANKEIFKSATLQHSISSNLKNIFSIKKFEPLYEYFEVANWLRVQIDDKIYKLRLLEYEIDYSNLSSLSTVDFSDVLRVINGISDSKSIFDKAASMTTSYDYVQRQAEQGSKSNQVVNGWTNNGLDVTKTKILSNAEGQTQTWDKHGLLLRKYDSITESYDNEQMTILNSSILITNDNWETAKTAVGGYYYNDPVTGELKYTYGVNAETLVGNLILGENLGIYTDNGSLTFNHDGLNMTNGVNTFSVNPNSDKLLSLSKNNNEIFGVDKNGNGIFSGNIIGSSGEFTKSFKINIPVLEDGNGGTVNWIMSSSRNDYGTILKTEYNGEDPMYMDTEVLFNYHGEIDMIASHSIDLHLSTDNVSVKPWIYLDYNCTRIHNGEIEIFSDDGTTIHGGLYVVGSKSRQVNTKSYGERLLYCYEMTSPIFGDIGHGIIGEDGLCYIDIELIFAETIDTVQNYSVFLQSYSDKPMYVCQKEDNFFIVKGTPNTEFDFEIKAKQIDYPIERLEEKISSNNEIEVDYVKHAIKYLKTYEKELIENEQY